jgi:hypothetical protein
MVMDEPLDFEKEEDPLLPAPIPAKRYRSVTTAFPSLPIQGILHLGGWGWGWGGGVRCGA